MIRFKTWIITLDGEYPVVSKVKVRQEGESEGEEYFVPTYFPRCIVGAFEILHRVTSTDASRDCKTLKEAIKAINDNHDELVKLLKETYAEDNVRDK